MEHKDEAFHVGASRRRFPVCRESSVDRIGLGTPYYYAPPPPPAAVYTPPCPGPGYEWIPGYHYPAGGGYAWHAGFWARPPYVGAYWVAPRYYEHRYYSGYWERRHWDRGNDERWEHHDRGLHRGWYKNHHYD